MICNQIMMLWGLTLVNILIRCQWCSARHTLISLYNMHYVSPSCLCEILAQAPWLKHLVNTCEVVASMVQHSKVTDLQCSDKHNAATFTKTAKIVAAALVKYGKYSDGLPRLLDVNSVLTSKNNRMGGPLNMVYVHVGICKRSFLGQGYDPKRPRPGVVKENVSKAGIEALQLHNQQLMQGNDLFPPIHKDIAVNESLAGSHITVSFRLFKAQKQSSITGETFIVPADDDDLQGVVDKGYCYWICVEALPDDLAELVSEYCNSDQNQNKVFDADRAFLNPRPPCPLCPKHLPSDNIKVQLKSTWRTPKLMILSSNLCFKALSGAFPRQRLAHLNLCLFLYASIICSAGVIHECQHKFKSC